MKRKRAKVKYSAVDQPAGTATVRTNIIMEEPLIEEAKAVTGIKTKTGVIHYALREVVRRQKIRDLLKLRGKVKFWDGYIEEHVKPRNRATRSV